MFLFFQPVDNELVVELNEPSGKVLGHIRKSVGGRNFYAYEGIPYAQPPVGLNRFAVSEKWFLFLMSGGVICIK